MVDGWAAAVRLGTLVGYNDRSDYLVGDYSGWQNYELSAAADIKLTEELTLTPSLLYSSPISSAAKDAIDSQWMAGVNLTYNYSF